MNFAEHFAKYFSLFFLFLFGGEWPVVSILGVSNFEPLLENYFFLSIRINLQWMIFLFEEKSFSLSVYLDSFFWCINRLQNLWCHHIYYCIHTYDCFFRILDLLCQILVYVMSDISSLYLVLFWRLETSFRPFWDFNNNDSIIRYFHLY